MGKITEFMYVYSTQVLGVEKLETTWGLPLINMIFNINSITTVLKLREPWRFDTSVVLTVN